MRLLIPCSFVLVAVFTGPAPAQPDSVLLYPLLQTHMPTRHGNVPPPPTLGQMPTPNPEGKIKLDPVQMQSEARELLELTQSLQSDIDSVNHGVLPKDTIGKLKRIEKLAKHLRGEIAP